MKDSVVPQARMDFPRAIAPMTPEAFFSEYFEKRHLVVQRADPGYYRDLLTIDDIDHVLTAMVLPVSDLQLVKDGAGVDEDHYSLSAGQVDPVRVAEHFAQGSTIILPQLQRRLPKLATYCRAMEGVFSCDLQTNIYFTPANAQGFLTHYDSHDVFVLQTHGTKTWRIYESPMVLPLRSQAFDPAGFEAGALIDTFVLGPGDMAYIPRGVVHDATATDEMSLHITTGLLTPRWIDLLVEALVQQALVEPALRAALPPGHANAGFDSSAMAAQFHRLMAQAAEQIDPVSTFESFAAEFRQRRLPVVPGQFLQRVAVDGTGPDSMVALRPDLIWRMVARPATEEEGDEGEIVLSVYDVDIAFPAYVEEVLRDALSRPQFRVDDLAGDLDSAGKVVLVKRLIREGVLSLTG
ncbi:cupin domain-containing protein [Pararhodobacter sp.]|uniref:cupin domain-containing protein n=1 Tax=Pararhodobacter sp. TaxID=2127056 RepID=UPI002FDCB87A